MSRYFKLNSIVGVIDRVLSWQSKGVSNESIKPPTTSNNSLTPELNYYNNTKTRVKFKGSCLKQSNFTFTHNKILNIYIVYELGASSSHISDPTLKSCLFGAVALTKMQILTIISIQAMALGLIEGEVFHFLVVGLAKRC